MAVGDSLLWGARPGQLAGMEAAAAAADRQFLYRTEDADVLQRIFSRQYPAVVGNPPYIVCQDPALNQRTATAIESCHRQYSLGVPFTERFFDLAVPSDDLGRPAGFVGNDHRQLVHEARVRQEADRGVPPDMDLTHVIDTSGAYIPGHGTPTVILFGRHQRPVLSTIRTVMGIRGEPSDPVKRPAKGLVWTAIVDQIDQPGSESELRQRRRHRAGQVCAGTRGASVAAALRN